MKVSCPRSFEAEAWRDGRLHGAEEARFRAHASSCASCTQELRSLDALGEALRAPAATDADQLHVRRERTRLLAAFDARLVATGRRPRRLLWFAGAVAALGAVAIFFLLRVPGPSGTLPSTSQRAAAEPVQVRATSTARWSRSERAGRETIFLEDGELSIKVDHSAQRRLLVVLPDGELEDIGTTFSVSADGGRTTRVAVLEGSVLVRLNGRRPLALAAGEAWTPAAEPTPSLAVAPSSSSPRSLAPRASRAPATQTTAAPSSQPAPDSADEFRAAMAALDGGDSARAAALFGAFAAQHPHDSRAEDADYLRVIALQRTGNVSATREAASDYLRRHPHGFRAAEVAALAGN